MNKLFTAFCIAPFFFCVPAHSQERVLTCEFKTVSGEGVTKPVAELKVGSVLDLPQSALKVEGASYTARDLFDTETMGEYTSLSINRETSEFEFSSSYRKAAKRGTGVCKIKALKL